VIPEKKKIKMANKLAVGAEEEQLENSSNACENISEKNFDLKDKNGGEKKGKTKKKKTKEKYWW